MTDNTKNTGENAFLAKSPYGRIHDMTYGGALSFLRSLYTRDLEGVDVAITGLPFDNATTYRPGARLGPRAVRAGSAQLSELNAFPYNFDPFEKLAVIDYGDCFIDPHHPDTVIPSIEGHISEILAGGAMPLSIGGDHFATYPCLRAVAAKYGPVALIHFDAHSDTWPDDGTAFDHGTMFLRAKREGLVDVDKSVQVGIRTANDETHGFDVLTAPFVHRTPLDTIVERIRARVGDAPIYLTFDIDCLDPSAAPGTGTPVVGGLTSAQALHIIQGLKGLNIVAADVMEVAPAYDVAEITAIAAATIAHQIICLKALEKGTIPNPIGEI